MTDDTKTLHGNGPEYKRQASSVRRRGTGDKGQGGVAVESER